MNNSKLQTELRQRQMALGREKVTTWKRKVAKRFATQLGVHKQKIKIYPWNNKRQLTIAHQYLGEIVCPSNQRLYFAYLDLR